MSDPLPPNGERHAEARVFGYVDPTIEQAYALENVNNELEAAVIIVTANVPDSAERTLALRHLEIAGFFANKAIVRDGKSYLPRGDGR